MISQTIMAHVNMMTDTIIANLAPDGLRSVLRGILAHNHDTTQIFEQQTRLYLQRTTPNKIGALFSTDDSGRTAPTDDFTKCQSRVRCMLGCGLCWNSLPTLIFIIDEVATIPLLKRNSDDAELLDILAYVDGDIVQAVTALEKTIPSSNGSRKIAERERGSLEELLRSLRACRSNWRESQQPFPLERGLGAVLGLLDLSNCSRDGATSQIALDLNMSPQARVGIETFEVHGITVPRLFCGLWQLSSPSWGTASHSAIMTQFLQHVHAGFSAFDMADHYGDAEILFVYLPYLPNSC